MERTTSCLALFLVFAVATAATAAAVTDPDPAAEAIGRLVDAIQSGQPVEDVLQRVAELKDVADINGIPATADGRAEATPLCVAAMSGSAEVVRALADAGASLNAACGPGTKAAPLHAASFRGEAQVTAEVVQVLVERGVDLDAREDSGLTPLMAFAMRNAAAAAAALVRAGANSGLTVTLSDEVGERPVTALGYAMLFGFPDTVRAMLEAGAAVDEVTLQNALLVVSANKLPAGVAREMYLALLDRGGDPNYSFKIKEVDPSLDIDGSYSGLASAIAAEDTELLELLLARGASTKLSPTSEPIICMSISAFNDAEKRLTAVTALVKAGMDCKVQCTATALSQKSLTPLEAAKKLKDDKLVRVLAKCSKKKSKKSKKRRSDSTKQQRDL